MAFSRNEILKAWDEVVSNFDDPNEPEIAAASAIVCAKFPGLTPNDIRDALRASVEELEGELASAERALKILKAMDDEEREGTLAGLPGGRRSKGGADARLPQALASRALVDRAIASLTEIEVT